MKTRCVKKVRCNTMPCLTRTMQAVSVAAKEAKAVTRGKNENWEVKTVEPQIMFGIDYFFELLESKEIQYLPSGFTLLDTPVGHLLAGKGKLESGGINDPDCSLNSTRYILFSMGKKPLKTRQKSFGNWNCWVFRIPQMKMMTKLHSRDFRRVFISKKVVIA